jgi:hypothetical protein
MLSDTMIIFMRNVKMNFTTTVSIRSRIKSFEIIIFQQRYQNGHAENQIHLCRIVNVHYY